VGDTALIFASDGQLELLRSYRLVYVDATFRVVPSLFYQLFTVFVQHTDDSFPVLYAIMTRKKLHCISMRLRKAACINTTVT